MGYTHYFWYPPESAEWRSMSPRLLLDAKKIVDVTAELGIGLAGYSEEAGAYRKSTPVVTEGGVFLQGWGGEDFEHESLVIEATPDLSWDYARQCYERHGGVHWSFCKTARKPYDLAVATILLRAAMLMPSVFGLGSDGHWSEEWLAGAMPGYPMGARTLYGRLFEDIPLTEDASPFNRAPDKLEAAT